MSALASAAARLAALLAVALLVPAHPRAEDDVPLRAMRDELARSARELRLEQMERPYFVSYRMDDVDRTTISATLGSLTAVRRMALRTLSVEVRVGDYAFDNTNYVATGGFGGHAAGGRALVPLDDDYALIRRQLWLTTDAEYKKALADLSGKRAALRTRRSADELPDFTREDAVDHREPRPEARAARAALEALARDVSAVFRAAPEIQASSVEVDVRDAYTRFASTEGTSFTRAAPALVLRIRASTQAESSLPISDAIVVHGRGPADLPPRDALLSRARELAARLVALRAAPSIERYDGPVLFEAAGAAELFAQVFAPGLVAVRQPTSDDPRLDTASRQFLSHIGIAAFQDRIGARVLPAFLDVTDDPLRGDEGGAPLLGGRPIDDEGVPTRQTKLVERGVLRAVLATRVPVRSAPRSTGSRRGGGAAPSNLCVTSERTASAAELRAELLRRARERGLPYAIVVRRVGGGTSARMQSRLGLPGGDGGAALAEVVRVRPDGTEEPLQGVELDEVTAAAFKDVAAVGNAPAVLSTEFAGGAGALFSAGSLADPYGPVTSYVVPAMLFDDLSLTRSRGPFPNPPLAPSPLARR